MRLNGGKTFKHRCLLHGILNIAKEPKVLPQNFKKGQLEMQPARRDGTNLLLRC
jgi:hypothetical protein